ncbi:response regulator [Candidatus Dojkabacteria bacterium]|nr:response regulator [Candidatus Dojkabacteria bacterium]
MPGDKKKILIAEDDKSIAMALELKLKNVGFDVTVANDGAEAVEYLSKTTYDLALLDLIMPRKDGFTVLEEVDPKKLQTPIIVLTNLSSLEDEEKALKLGAKDYFVKSNMSLSEIVDYINRFFTHENK